MLNAERMFEIRQYNEVLQQEWDAFIDRSKNGTFMLKRGYMDYHKDRFMDCSLLLYLKDHLWGVFAGNADGDTWYGHQGLTYGGLIMSEKCVGADVLTAFCQVNKWLKERGIKKVVYKPIPHIYSRMASEEDLYALFRCGAHITARGLSTCIDMSQQMKWRQTRRTALNKAMQQEVRVEIAEDIAPFWAILETNLKERHNVKPVHTLSEMQLLMSRFPNEIVLYQAKNKEENVIAGILLYKYKQVIHSQYISANEEGKQCGAIEAIMHEIMRLDAQYFDFGISTENGGLYLNENLIFQKEGFGGRGICYDTYEYNIT